MKGVLAAALVFAFVTVVSSDACWKESSTRGVGTIPDTCPSDQDKNGALCYPKCSDGYYGVGPVCWQSCPAGYTDMGALCQPALTSGDNGGCPWYDKCGLTFAKGCVKCPQGMNTDGCVCNGGNVFAKSSYGRGAGNLMSCSADKVEDAGLCYPPCPSGSVGVSFVCWDTCQPGWTDCGAMCTDSLTTCVGAVKDIAEKVVQATNAVADCAESDGTDCDASGLAKTLAGLISQMALPVC